MISILIVGVGSIGRRHIENLLILKDVKLILYTKRTDLQEFTKQGIKISDSLVECLKENPNFNNRIDYKFSNDGHYYENKKNGQKIGRYKSIGNHKLDKLLNKDKNYYLDLWFKKDIYHT